jgi:hypothetical protein
MRIGGQVRGLPPGSIGGQVRCTAPRLLRPFPPERMAGFPGGLRIPVEPNPEPGPNPLDHEATGFLVACSPPPHSQEFNLRLFTNLNRCPPSRWHIHAAAPPGGAGWGISPSWYAWPRRRHLRRTGAYRIIVPYGTWMMRRGAGRGSKGRWRDRCARVCGPPGQSHLSSRRWHL